MGINAQKGTETVSVEQNGQVVSRREILFALTTGVGMALSGCVQEKPSRRDTIESGRNAMSTAETYLYEQWNSLIERKSLQKICESHSTRFPVQDEDFWSEAMKGLESERVSIVEGYLQNFAAEYGRRMAHGTTMTEEGVRAYAKSGISFDIFQFVDDLRKEKGKAE